MPIKFDHSANMKWICQGDPNDHHSVIQCAPDKIPELAPNQVGKQQRQQQQ